MIHPGRNYFARIAVFTAAICGFAAGDLQAQSLLQARSSSDGLFAPRVQQKPALFPTAPVRQTRAEPASGDLSGFADRLEAVEPFAMTRQAPPESLQMTFKEIAERRDKLVDRSVLRAADQEAENMAPFFAKAKTVKTFRRDLFKRTKADGTEEEPTQVAAQRRVSPKVLLAGVVAPLILGSVCLAVAFAFGGFKKQAAAFRRRRQGGTEAPDLTPRPWRWRRRWWQRKAKEEQEAERQRHISPTIAKALR